MTLISLDFEASLGNSCLWQYTPEGVRSNSLPGKLRDHKFRKGPSIGQRFSRPSGLDMGLNVLAFNEKHMATWQTKMWNTIMIARLFIIYLRKSCSTALNLFSVISFLAFLSSPN